MTVKSDTKTKAEIKDQVNEISMLLVMSSAQDEIGVNMICDSWETLQKVLASDPTYARLVGAWKAVKAQKATISPEAFFALLQDLVNCAVQFCEGSTEVCFPNEKKTTPDSNDMLAGVDVTFLPEFIETHRMQLEEFESWLLNCEFNGDQGEDVGALIKRYVHSLKGDAGSLGLLGIQEACHYVEDVLSHASAQTLIPQLMLFREWVISCLDALTHQTSPAQSPESFIKRFKQACELLLPSSSEKAAPAPTTPEVPVATFQSNNLKSSDSETYTLSGERDIFQEFVAEAEEHLGNVESILLDSEGSYNKDSIDTIFRGIHSLKGGSAYFTFKEMTETSHLLENMLDEVRSGKRELDPTLTGLVLSYIDLQKGLLANAKKALAADGVITKSRASNDFLRALNEYARGSAGVEPTREAAPAATPQVVNIDRPSSATSDPEVVSGATSGEGKDTSSSNKADKLEVKNFVKVDTIRLDHLIDSIGEMVIYSSMLIRRCRELLPQYEDVQSVTHRVEKFTRDLQDVGMSMRLVPIKGLFQKMSRLVWDTSKKIKKEIVFSMEGEDTELDRNLIDKLADPLMHMVRNALDHGVESPQEREQSGKPRSGKVHLSANHSGGCVLIKIQDDGRGLNPDKLLAKAKEKGIITEGQKLSEQETFQLIFAPGFSTAAVVTDISGRGVGMDVVRRNVESLRGRIHIESKIGHGTTFTIELPLTLAIIDGIEVLVGQEHLIVPSLAIVEFVRPNSEMLNNTLEQGETFFFRGKYLPIFRVGDLFDIEPRFSNPLNATLIVVENHEELIALMVDEIVGELSTVIKSLGALFSDVKGVSGCAVMPNGDAALILDVRALVLLARANYHRRANLTVEHSAHV